MRSILAAALLLGIFAGVAAGQAQRRRRPAPVPPSAQWPAGTTDEQRYFRLPLATIGQEYREQLRIPGPPPHNWLLKEGTLPPGLQLDADGLIFGTPTNGGTYRFTASVTDGKSVTSEHRYVIRVGEQFDVEWRQLPFVSGAKIQGIVRVTNGTTDTIDLTVVIVAVNEVNKAFTLGYQRFTFRPSAIQDIVFGSQITLPLGQYIIHADAVGEVASKNLILRSRQQADRPLAITVQ